MVFTNKAKITVSGDKHYVCVGKQRGTWFIDAYSTDLTTGNYKLVDSKGFGEVTMVGFASAVANAVFHATAKEFANYQLRRIS